MKRLGLTVWNDDSVQRSERGIEVAGNVIAWGLANGQLINAQQHEFAEFLELFELLTGTVLPRSLGDAVATALPR